MPTQTPRMLNFHCDKCDYSTRDKSNLTKHKLRQGDSPNSALRCPEGSCTLSFLNLNEIDTHLKNNRSRKLEVEQLFFTNQNELKTMKQDIQRLEFSKYILKGSNSRQSSCYYCNRSSRFPSVSKSTGKRNAQKIGYTKSGRIRLDT